MADPIIYKKLQIKKYANRLLLDKPEDVDELSVNDFDTFIGKETYDCIIAFVWTLDEMKERIKAIHGRKLLTENGYLYLAYPKRGNGVYDYHIDRDAIFPKLEVDEETGFVKGTKLKFSKMVSLNKIFTIVGLKNTSGKVVVGVSQRVDDYEEKVPVIEAALAGEVKVLFKGLTSGYQKEWARYIYSGRKEETQKRRFQEMQEILLAGYKSKNLYQQGKK